MCVREKAPPTPASPHTLLINHPNIKIWGERQRTTGSLTNTTIPGNRVEPGRRSRSVDLWVPVMKSRSFSLQSRVTPKTLKKKTTLPFFWQTSHPGHIQYQCLHMLTPATPAPSCYLNFSGGQSISERLTKRPGLLASFSFIQSISMTSAESRSVHSQMLSDVVCRRTAGVSQ